MTKSRKWPLVLVGLLIFSAVLFGFLLGKGLALTVNTINTENFTDFNTALPTRLVDINGELITEFANDEKREIISIHDLPQHMLDALLTREDRIFYSHQGFSAKALSRAVVGVLTKSSLGGGSTLTQQIAGTLYCDRTEMSVTRKLKELWWAIQMERHYSKDEILELYLNKIYFGGGTYGVNAASKYYFGHSAREITPAEAAILVIQLSNPMYYNPFDYPNRAMDRQRDVLNSMVKAKYITKEESQESFDNYWASFDFTRTSASAYTMRNDEAPWFSEYVRRQLGDMLYGTEDIYTGGFTVNTTLNLSHQKVADKVMTDYIKAANRLYQRTMNSHERSAFGRYVPFSELLCLVFDISSLRLNQQRAKQMTMNAYRDTINPIVDIMSVMNNMDILKTEIVTKGNSLIKQNAERTTIEGTMISIENSTGYINALVGGSKYDQENQYIRAVQSKLQPGSTFKPLYYSEAIESHPVVDGKGPASMTAIISDTPVVFHKEDGSPYIPNDYKGKLEGDVEVWYALAHSMNIPSIKILDSIGFEAAIKRTSSLLGIPKEDLDDRGFVPVYPLGLGVCAVRPIEIARAFASIANNGKAVTPVSIISVLDKKGNVIAEPAQDIKNKQKNGAQQLIKPETAFIMQEILKNTVRSGTLRYGSDWDSTKYTIGERLGTGSKFRFTNMNGDSFIMPAAGKTGTTQNWADAWTVGFTPYYTSAFWFGFDRRGQSLGTQITGSTIAGVAWGDFMHEINKDKPYKDFRNDVPEGLIELDVCTLSGGLLTPECKRHVIHAYYYPGTEPTEPCKKHSDKTASTIGIKRIEEARWKSGFDFDTDEDFNQGLSVNLDFLKSDKLSSELKSESLFDDRFDYNEEENQDVFDNWLFD